MAEELLRQTVDAFEDVAYEDSPNLLQGLRENYKEMLDEQTVDAAISEGFPSTVRAEELKRQINVKPNISTEEAVDQFIEEHDGLETIPKDDEIVDFYMKHLVYLDIFINILEDPEDERLSEENVEIIYNAASDIFSDENALRQKYHTEYFQENVANVLNSEGYPIAFAYDPNVYRLNFTISSEDFAGNVVRLINNTYQNPNEVFKGTKNDAMDWLELQLVDDRYYKIELNEDQLISSEDAQSLVEEYKENFQVDTSQFNYQLIAGNIEAEFPGDVLNAKEEVVRDAVPEINSEDLRFILENFDDVFDVKVHKPSSNSEYQEVALKLIDDYQIYNDEMAQQILYDKYALMGQISSEGLFGIGVVIPERISITYEVEEYEMRDIWLKLSDYQ